MQKISTITTNFYIPQVYTALRTDQLLQPLQQEVFHTLQAHIETMNENQLRAYQKHVQKQKEKPVEESYTSKASFLDNDVIPTYGEEDIPVFSGKRITRGLYRTKENLLLNADVNASYKILKKAVPKVFADGIEGLRH